MRVGERTVRFTLFLMIFLKIFLRVLGFGGCRTHTPPTSGRPGRFYNAHAFRRMSVFSAGQTKLSFCWCIRLLQIIADVNPLPAFAIFFVLKLLSNFFRSYVTILYVQKAIIEDRRERTYCFTNRNTRLPVRFVLTESSLLWYFLLNLPMAYI